MRRFDQMERKTGELPLILKLDRAGLPSKWIPWQESVVMGCTGKVLWHHGEAIQVRAGTNAATGTPSLYDLYPIIACDEKPRKKTPSLTNRQLFARDHHHCLFCAKPFPAAKLTRDHIIPVSRGGANSYTNCATACRSCNHRKADRTPEEAGMKLIAVPYLPSPAEALWIQNTRRIIADQMDFLKGRMTPEQLVRMRLN